MLTRIHVNRFNLMRNTRYGENLPVFTAKNYKGNHKGDKVEIGGPSTLVYRRDRPFRGARAFIETTSAVFVDDKRVA